MIAFFDRGIEVSGALAFAETDEVACFVRRFRCVEASARRLVLAGCRIGAFGPAVLRDFDMV
jgi:hypothetical protein